MACVVHERTRDYVCRRITITSPAENTTMVIFAIRCLAADRSTEIRLMFEHEPPVSCVSELRQCICTRDNDDECPRAARYYFEIFIAFVRHFLGLSRRACSRAEFEERTTRENAGNVTLGETRMDASNVLSLTRVTWNERISL